VVFIITYKKKKFKLKFDKKKAINSFKKLMIKKIIVIRKCMNCLFLYKCIYIFNLSLYCHIQPNNNGVHVF